MASIEDEGSERQRSVAYDPLALSSLQVRTDRLLSEIEQFDMPKMVVREELASVREKMAGLLDAINLQLISEIRFVAGTLGINPDTLTIEGPQELAVTYAVIYDAADVGETETQLYAMFRASLSTLLRLIMQARSELPARKADGGYDREILGTPFDPTREHPYGVRNIRGFWGRIRIAIIDYLQLREGLLRSKGFAVTGRPPVVTFDTSEICSQLQRAYWTEQISVAAMQIALLRVDVINGLELLKDVPADTILKTETNKLIGALSVSGFRPLTPMAGFIRLVKEMEVNFQLGVIPRNSEQNSFLIMSNTYHLAFATDKRLIDRRKAIETIVEGARDA